MILDCDEIYHRLLRSDEALLHAIESRFPEAFSQGKLDRKALGQIVFADAAALGALNEITHRAVSNAVMRELKKMTPSPFLKAG